MNHKMKKGNRTFGNEIQNTLDFINRHNSPKNGQNKEKIEDSIKLIQKAIMFQNNPIKRNNMFMKLSHNPLQYINNNAKDKNNIEDAIIKNKININKMKDEEYIVKDYSQSFLDDYGEDVFNSIKKDEQMNACDYSSKDLFGLQDKDYLNEKNRGIILQWLVYNNNRWKLNDDIIFMAMNIFDRYISQYKVGKSEFQLVAISSYLIASKYENTYPPYIEELSHICNFIYTKDDIIRKEYAILSGLNFDILYNSSYKYLTFLHSIADKENMKLLYLSQLILELSLEHVDILVYSQSKRACAALLLAKKIMQIQRSWNELRFYYNYNEHEIKCIQKKMIILLNSVIKNKTQNSIFEKFESSRYESVSSFLVNLCHNPNNRKQKNDGKIWGNINDENKPYNH